MFIKDSYLLTASHTFEVKEMQEITVNIELAKVPSCYHTLLIGRVLHKKMPIKRAVVQVYDCKDNPLFHAVTNCKGVYRFSNILAPGIYKVVATADGYWTSRTRKIKIKTNKVIRMSFHLKKCSIFNNGIIYGKVRVADSKKPIEGACIYLKDEDGKVYKTTSNKDGQYIIYNIRPNCYQLIVRKHGYRTFKTSALSVDKNDRIMLYVDLKERCGNYNRTISGVINYKDKPVSDAPVFLFRVDNEGNKSLAKVQLTNGEGAFMFTSIPEGTYILKGKSQSREKFEKLIY
jgi:hypothetical protein